MKKTVLLFSLLFTLLLFVGCATESQNTTPTQVTSQEEQVISQPEQQTGSQDNKEKQPNKETSNTQTTNKPSSKKQPSKQNTAITISKEKATSIALQHAKVDKNTVRNLSVEYERDDGVGYYEIEFFVGKSNYEYEINATSGKVLKAEKDEKPISSTASTNANVTISKEKVKNLVLQHANLSSALVRNYKIELNNNATTPIYEVEFEANGYEYDYYVDAQTGKILRSHKKKD